ncbi:catechol 1,2-dioxygenase-like protein [Nemania sp. NC0429]|nr:catechol 1,2-dioxygenase-like protein [Nemania sp. NC0429]
MIYIDKVAAWSWARVSHQVSSFLGGDGLAEVDDDGDGKGKDRGGSNAEYDLRFTESVIAATGRDAHPRLREIMPALIRHMHDFAREVDLTVAELMAGVAMINEAGRMSTDRRNETQLICDVLGLESLVDEITSKKLSARTADSSNNINSNAATPSTVLGPFYRVDAPSLANGSSMIAASMLGTPWYERAAPLLARISGQVRSAATREPIAGATVDVWLAGPDGTYEQQDPEQSDMNLRGRLRTDADGRYETYALRPTAYPIPADGPAGRLLGLLDRSPWRPAHVHFLVAAEGYGALTTQVFDAEDPRARGEGGGDAVFAVKEELLVRFEERRGDERARWELRYDFVLREA